MDKYEYRVSLNEINSLVEERRYEEAAQIADGIDWRKVKSKDTLCRISDIYMRCRDVERARDILDLANQRNPHVPEIIYSLCDLTIHLYGRTGSQSDLAKAIGLKQEYESAWPDNPKRLILEYKFYKVSPVTVDEKIATLERLRKEDHSSRWGYELATLYHEAGMDELAVDECRTLRHEFNTDKFVAKATALEQELKRAYKDKAADAEERPQDGAAEESAAPVREAAPDTTDVAPERRDTPEEPVRAAAEPVEAEIREAPVREEGYRKAETDGREPADAASAVPAETAAETANEMPDETEISGIRRKPYRDPAASVEQPREYAPEQGSVERERVPEREPAREFETEERTPRAAFKVTAPETEPELPEIGPASDATPDDQLSVGQVYDEWERIRKDIRKRNDEKRAQRIMEDTGPLLQDFDETARHGLIESIEKDAARDRRKIRSGAASILGNDAGYGNGYGRGGNDRYADPYGSRRGANRYDNRYAEPAEDRHERYDDRYAEPAEDRHERYDDRYDDRYAEPVEDRYDRYDDRYAEPAEDERYDDRYAEPVENQDDRQDRYDDRYAERPAYEPLPEPEDTDSGREEITAETVRETDEDDVRDGINDHRSGIVEAAAGAAALAAAGYAAGAARGSRFNAAMHVADAAAGAAAPIADAAESLAEDDDDIATRRWNSDEVRKAMEAQKARIAEAEAAAAAEEARRKAEEEAARIAAEEEARRQAEEEAARKAAEEKAAALAAERARIEAEIRAEYEAKERARIEAEEAARKAAEEKAAAEAKAREEAAARERMRAEIEAQIRAEFEERERARLEALGVTATQDVPGSGTLPEDTAGAPDVAAPADENMAAGQVPAPAQEAAPVEETASEAAYDAAPAGFAVNPALAAQVEPDEALVASITAQEIQPEPDYTADVEPSVFAESAETEVMSDTDPENQPEEPETAPAQETFGGESLKEAAGEESLPEESVEDDAEPARKPRKERGRFRRGRTIDDDLAQPAEETAELPASAASSIAAAAEKAPSKEELRLFGPFYRMKENRDQVTAALDKISLASYTGNMIITGNAVTARRVAQGLLELTREADSNFTGKIAKATGAALNKLTEDKFRSVLTKIQNGALIIEHASAMDEAAVQRLSNELDNGSRGIIVVMMDARKPLDEFLAQYSAQTSSFTARVDIRPLNDKALVEYGKDYANTRDYALDELAELALSSRISSMQSPNHRVTLKEVRDIVDEAISYASKKSPKVLMDMISHKRYDEDDRILLHEKDFQHY